MAQVMAVDTDFAQFGGKGRVGGGISSTVVQPSESDVQAFTQMLGGVQEASSSSVPLVTETQTTKPVQADVMDAIRSGLTDASMSHEFRANRLTEIAKTAEKSNSISEIFQFQLESMRMSVELDFTGKVVSKAAQNVEQLTKQQ